MRLLSLLSGKMTGQRLLGSGLVLVVSAFAACGSPSGVSGGVTPARPTHHDWQIIINTDSSGGPSSGAQNVRAAYIKSAQAEAGPEYAALQPSAADAGSFRFDNHSQQLSADLGADGLRVAVAHGDVHGAAAFHLASYGCANDSGTRLAAVRPNARTNRVSYSHPGLVEWYQNGKLGVEQGFDLQQAPSCRAGSPDQAVELKLELTHRLHATLMHGHDGGEWLELRDDSGRQVLRYSDLYAEDADHKALPAKMALNGDVLTLRIDDRAARYPLRVDPLIWAQSGVPYKTGDADADDHFGFSIAVSGDHAIVGASGDDKGGTDAGAWYIYLMNSQGTWTQQVKVFGATPGANYGAVVAITDLGGGDKRVVIGAPGDSGGNGLANWFRGRGTAWIPEAEFSGNGHFGGSVGVSKDRIIIGAPFEVGKDGTARIYEPDITMVSQPWAEVAQFTEPMGTAGQLGSGVAIDGAVALIGEPFFNGVGPKSGRALIYERAPSGLWTQTATLTAGDTAANDNFGNSVALFGLTAVIGAPAKNGLTGGAYVYSDIFGNWAQTARLHTAAGLALAAGDQFGANLSIASNLIVVGAPLSSPGAVSTAGAAYLFTGSGVPPTWSLTRQLLPPTPTATEQFGNAVSIDRGLGHILVGAPFNNLISNASGAFHDFTLRKDIGDPCAAGAECASDFCVDGVCCNTTCGGGDDTDCQACSAAKGAAVTGTCGTTLATANWSCRGAAGTCDLPEICNGTTAACPGDTFMAPGTSCRAAVGACDIAETCTGTAACPADAVKPVQTVCRPSAGGCDAVELCDGSSKACPADLFLPQFATCRAAAGQCDIAETCDGATAACPTDTFMAVGASCRAAVGACDIAETCTGTAACPADAVKPVQTVCRPSAGGCDAVELCDGSSKACPADLFLPKSTLCRAAASACDQAELCDGMTPACPVDNLSTNNSGGCAGADLSITLTGPAAIDNQRELPYTLTVINFGPSTATSPTVTITLPTGASLLNSIGAGALCQPSQAGVQCTLTDLTNQQTTSISLLISPPGSVDRMTLTATVGATTPDPSLANNTATLDQNLLSPRVSGGGAGCSVVAPGGAPGPGGLGSLMALLILAARRRRRSA